MTKTDEPLVLPTENYKNDPYPLQNRHFSPLRREIAEWKSHNVVSREEETIVYSHWLLVPIPAQPVLRGLLL